MTKQLLLYVMCVGMLMSAPTMLAAQTREAERQTTVEGTVEAVDHAARTVTIRLKDGKVVTLDVPAEAVRFDQVKVGTPVPGQLLRLGQHSAEARGRAGGRQDRSAHYRSDNRVSAGRHEIQAARDHRYHHRLGSRQQDCELHRTKRDDYSRGLLDTTDPKIVEGLKKGDRVDVTRLEAATLTVSQQTVAVSAQSESLRNRLTLSVLYGVDNQFSGKMIQEATGRTTGGAAINLDETTYDEVYGRVAMFKVGIGYRTTPRTEGVFNFVWSSSDATETATPVGTVGSTPLHVNFTGYGTWGVEGGQRWFFARTRFTPLRRLPCGPQSAPGHPRDVRRCAGWCHARACGAGRQVLRKIMGVQPWPDRRLSHRPWSHRVDGRGAVPFPGRSVGRRLAGRRRAERYQQRELALVDPVSGRRAHPVLTDPQRTANDFSTSISPSALLTSTRHFPGLLMVSWL